LPSRIAANQFAVERMAADQLREVIEKPLALAGVEPEPGLVDELLEDAGDEPGNLPLLEHALFQLWDQPAGRRFTHEAYRAMGGLAGALEHHAEAVYEGLDAEGRDLLRRLLPRLAVVGEARAVTRRRVPKEDLLAASGPGEEGRARAAALLDLWVERRLLTAMGAGAEAGEERIEVAHEALLRSWDRLRGWLEEDWEFLLWRQGLVEAVDAWECGERSEGDLLRGNPLRRAADWLERRRQDLTPSEVDLVEASLAHERKERRRELAQARKLTAAVGGVALLLLLALAGTVWLYQREQRRSQLLRARGLATQVATVVESSPQLGTLLALHALRIAEGAGESRLPEGETALRSALARLGGRVVGDTAEKVLDGLVNDDVVALATTERGDEGGPLRLRRVPLPLPEDWEIAAGEATTVMEDRVSQAALAPSGRWLAANAEGRPARLWRIGARTGDVTPVALQDGKGREYAVSTATLRFERADGQERLIVGGLDGQERSWELPAMAPESPLALASIRPAPPEAEALNMTFLCAERFLEHLTSIDETLWISQINPLFSDDLENIGFTGHDDRLSGCSFGTGRRFLTWTNDEPARLWNIDAPPTLARGPEPRLVLNTDQPGQVFLAASARWVGVNPLEGEPRIWHFDNGREGRRVGCGSDAKIHSIAALTADSGRLVLREGGSGRLCVVDPLVEEPKPLELAVTAHGTSSMVAGPDAAWVVLFDDSGGVFPVDPECPEEPEPLRSHLMGDVVSAVSSDGRWLASADPLGILYLTRVERAEPCDRFLPVHSWSLSDQPAVVLALGAGYLAAGFFGGEIRLWALDGDFGEARLLVGHDMPVTRLTFGPDGTWLASVDMSGRVLLWDVLGAEEPVRIPVARGVAALGFGGGELLVAGAGAETPDDFDGRVYAFTLDLDRLRTLACRAAGRDLSAAEAREFLGEEGPPLVCPGLPRGAG
ncbi:MAG TPA: WD40 repeat domain-containing protein, partial [Thermoanaerobaculia bacterium]|nr:WD40 repeat domain-containing protein [Thermoanaerobaculia bacterium]